MMTVSRRVGVNRWIVAISQIAKPRFSPPFYPRPTCLGNCINSTLRFACISTVSAGQKGLSFNGFLWMTFHLGRKRAPLVQIQRNHPSTKTFLLCEVSLEFQRRTWNFSVPIWNCSSRTAVYFLCPFKARKHYRQWNNCLFFLGSKQDQRFQPANAYHFTVTKQFMVISSRIHFPCK